MSTPRELREALEQSFFTVEKVENLIFFGLSEQPARIIQRNADLDTAVQNVLQWAEAHERVPDLLVAARYESPTNSKLRKIAEELGVAARSGHLESVFAPGKTLVDVENWRKTMSLRELPVCRVEVNGVPLGTGFLVGPDLVMTCRHVMCSVIQGSERPETVIVRFDYKVAENGTTLRIGQAYKLAGEWKVASDDELDFVVVRLVLSAGTELIGDQKGAPQRGWLQASDHALTAGERLFIIQHPDVGPMKLGVGALQDATSNSDHLCHDVDTLPGSSGSPCFTMDWKLVGIHQHGRDYAPKCAKNGAIAITGIAESPLLSEVIKLTGS